ncbi:Uncharacterized protein (ATP-grasp superfamily) [Chitinispirillum alkaliphilum]|nr:Uncharacterized protein (ATP-grasp superfamily) [Chitinispirillum alkaliphilum]
MNLLSRDHFTTPPIMYSAWTGAGNVGILSVDYLRRKLNSRLFAQIDMSRFISPDSVMVKGGVAQFPETPQSVFYHHHNPDLVIFESNAHAGAKNDQDIMKAILDLASDLQTPRIYTAAALPRSMSHKTESEVLFAANNPSLISKLNLMGFNSMPDGTITGLNGLMLGFAAARGIDALCMLATIPAYTASLTYPKGALAVVNALGKLENFTIDTAELELECRKIEPMFNGIEGKIREFFTISPDIEQIDQINGEQDVPEYVMNKIEKLFEEARVDRSRASELKEELDRWNLYPFYENRFLDLFEDD